MSNFRLESVQQLATLYPTLFSRKQLTDWREMFDDSAVVARAEHGTNTWVITIDDAMPEQIEYAEENELFLEEWSDIQIHEYGSIATLAASYTLTTDHEIRKGTDVVTLIRDNQGWRIVSLAYEQDELILK